MNLYPKTKPYYSGYFLIIIKKEDYKFNYVAQYNHRTNKWFRFNPFNHQENIIEIDMEIKQWSEIE
ncbi:hypothetical protein BAY07_15450 [Elizabethkingia bruuniana]|nr:hypothetical protein BAY07_15450 [Elizabethkingia bruuniana]